MEYPRLSTHSFAESHKLPLGVPQGRRVVGMVCNLGSIHYLRAVDSQADGLGGGGGAFAGTEKQGQDQPATSSQMIRVSDWLMDKAC